MDIRKLPKISLHDHLDGGLRPQTIIELAEEIGLELPATNARDLNQWFLESANSGSLVEHLKTFDITTAVMQTKHGLTRVAREFVEDLHKDGVIYGEIRWAPEQHLAKGLSLDEVVDAVADKGLPALRSRAPLDLAHGDVAQHVADVGVVGRRALPQHGVGVQRGGRGGGHVHRKDA